MKLKMTRALKVATTHTLAAAFVLSGCAEQEPPPEQGPEESAIPSCGDDLDAPLFDTLPVAAGAIDEVIVFGELDPGGGDVIPNAQSGIRLAGQGIALVAPGDGFVVGVRSSTFVSSPFREGETDFGLFLRPCQEVTATLLHVTTLPPDLADLLADAHCETYSTEDETIDDCRIEGLEIPISAGDPLGSVGGATAGGFDFDMVDTRSVAQVTDRAGDHYKHAVCFSRYFEGENRALLEERTGLLGEPRTGDPACGTIEVDVEGSAQGVWVTKENPRDYQGAADAYVTLAPDFLDPEGRQQFSFGAVELGQLLSVVRSGAGRTNLDFGRVEEDGLVYCYGTVEGTRSVLLSLAPDQELTLEIVVHDPSATPCQDAPDSWTFSENAVTYIR